MKKKLLAFLIGTMVLGTLLGGCKQTEKTVESESYNSETVVVEESSLDEIKEKDFSNLEFEEIYADYDDSIPLDNFYVALDDTGIEELYYYSFGNDEIGYIMGCNGTPGDIKNDERKPYAYKITKGTIQDMLDYLHAGMLDEIDSDDEETLEVITGDGYVEYVYVQPEQGKSGETTRFRCYPYEDTLQVLRYHYSNEDEEQELERINSLIHLNNSGELEDFYNELVEKYSDKHVEWYKGIDLYKEHGNQ